ncbi:hypothetical protein DVH05_016332 [Phytophthora capsici]|nr:hypothetical protein DVH05_016332 [Phytophthora capsici]
MRFCLLLCLFFLYVVEGDRASERPEKDLVSQYIHVPTSCETENCVAGGCLFENCATPLSCKGSARRRSVKEEPASLTILQRPRVQVAAVNS